MKNTLQPTMCQNSETEVAYDQDENLNKTNSAKPVSKAFKTIAR